MTESTALSESGASTDASDAVTVDHAAHAARLERRIAAMQTEHAEKLVRLELRAEALRHGMVDLDGLKLIDPKGITLDDDGEVRGASSVMRELKRSKPWLFGLAYATSSTAAAPPALPPRQKPARDMSHAEWQSARAELVKRR